MSDGSHDSLTHHPAGHDELAKTALTFDCKEIYGSSLDMFIMFEELSKMAFNFFLL